MTKPTTPEESPAKPTPTALKVLAVIAALVVVPGGAFIAAANIPTGGKIAIGTAVVWWLVVSAVIGKTLLKRRPDLRKPVRLALAAAAVVSVAAAFVATRGNTVDEQIATAGTGTELSDGAERDAALAGGGSSSDRPAGEADGSSGSDTAAGKDRPAGQEGDGSRKGAKTGRTREEGDSDGGSGSAPPTAPQGGRDDPGSRDEPRTQDSPAPASNVGLLSGAFTGESGHRGTGDAAVVELAAGGRVLTFSNFDVDPGGGGLLVYLHAGKTTSDKLGEFIELAKLKGTKGDQQYEIPDDVDLRRFSTVVIWCVPFTTRIAQAPLT